MRRIVQEQPTDDDSNLMFEKQSKKTIPVMVDCYDESEARCFFSKKYSMYLM